VVDPRAQTHSCNIRDIHYHFHDGPGRITSHIIWEKRRSCREIGISCAQFYPNLRNITLNALVSEQLIRNISAKIFHWIRTRSSERVILINSIRPMQRRERARWIILWIWNNLFFFFLWDLNEHSRYCESLFLYAWQCINFDLSMLNNCTLTIGIKTIIFFFFFIKESLLLIYFVTLGYANWFSSDRFVFFGQGIICAWIFSLNDYRSSHLFPRRQWYSKEVLPSINEDAQQRCCFALCPYALCNGIGSLASSG